MGQEFFFNFHCMYGLLPHMKCGTGGKVQYNIYMGDRGEERMKTGGQEDRGYRDYT